MSDDLTLDEVARQAEQRMLSGAEFTYGGLCDRFGPGHSRLIDRTIQRLRRKGQIEYRREGRNFIWQAVEPRNDQR